MYSGSRGTHAGKKGVNKAYAECLVSQAHGPMQTIVVLNGHSRQRRYPLFFAALSCPKAAIDVDFDACLAALS